MALNKDEKSKGFSMPALGEEVEDKFLKSLYPAPVKNMKWVYAMLFKVQGMQIQAELSMEVSDIIGNLVKLKTVFGDQVVENTTTLDTFSPVPSQSGPNNMSGFVFMNNEDVTVPYGSFKDTVKLSSTGREGENVLWIVSGIGPVKYGIKASGIPATLELKSFEK